MELIKASGKNPNPFYEVPEVKEPLVSPKADLDGIDLKETYLYDFPTQAGRTYTFSLQ